MQARLHTALCGPNGPFTSTNLLSKQMVKLFATCYGIPTRKVAQGTKSVLTLRVALEMKCDLTRVQRAPKFGC